MAASDSSQLFNAYYYAHNCGHPYQRDEHWLKFFSSIADRIVSDIGPSTVLDAGCAMGLLVECLRQRGVDAWGVDASEYAIQNVHPDVKPYCWIGSVTESFPQKYDLVVCIEVLEHLRKPQSEGALVNLCRHSDDILFSSTPVDYKETTHFNVHQPEYWAEMFSRQDFFRDVDFDASIISPWAVRFRRRSATLPRLVKEYERRYWELWKENVDLRSLTIEMEGRLAAQEELQNRKEGENDELRGQLTAIADSRSWHLMQKFQRARQLILPRGSRRERFLSRALEPFGRARSRSQD